MEEKDFGTEIKKSIEKQLHPCHYHKIPDQVWNPQARFNLEKKYDAYVIYQGCFIALEYKLHKKSSAFPFNSLRLIQKISLMDVSRSQANAYIVIGIRYANIRKCYFVSIDDYIKLMNESERKSLVLNELEKFPQARWKGAGEWELNLSWFKYHKKDVKTVRKIKTQNSQIF